MTAKQFFKSTSFKCIMVLLIIVLVSGIFLTFCNSLFYVSDDERLARAISSIYGEEVESEELEIDTSVTVSNATINNVYKITTYEGDYLLNITGAGGFSGGTVTCYVLVSKGTTTEVTKITISSNSGQSYISKIGDDDLETLVNQQESSGFSEFTTDGITTGATYSMTAIKNAANAALTYVSSANLVTVASAAYDYSLTAEVSNNE